MSKILEKQSRAKKIKILLKTYNRRFGKDLKEMSEHKEPVLMLMRNTRKVEWYDDASKGWFRFTHTDGTERRIKLSPEFLHSFDYGSKNFRGYLLHEDHPTPLPQKPVVTVETFQMAIDKTQHDLQNWRSKELTARA